MSNRKTFIVQITSLAILATVGEIFSTPIEEQIEIDSKEDSFLVSEDGEPMLRLSEDEHIIQTV